jgi:hypothetical protein
MEMIEDIGIPITIMVIAMVGMGWLFWYLIKTKWPEEIKQAREDAKQAREDLKTERAHFDVLLERVEKREDERIDKVIGKMDELIAVMNLLNRGK